jgi:hypothetical protein
LACSFFEDGYLVAEGRKRLTSTFKRQASS